MQHVSLCDWLIALTIMSCRFIHDVANSRNSKLSLNNIQCMYTHFLYPFFCQGQWDRLCILDIVNTVYVGVQISVRILHFRSFGYTPRNERLDPVAVLLLIFGGNSMLFSIMAAPFYYPTTNE